MSDSSYQPAGSGDHFKITLAAARHGAASAPEILHRFAVVGHDRGARVGYRPALDHPDMVAAFSSLSVVPTLDAM